MTGDCLFCKIANGELSSTKVYEDGEMVVITDIHPVAPVHLLLIPRRHIPSIAEMEAADQELIGLLFWRAKRIAESQGIAENGYRLVMNVRHDAGQVVDHLHLHLIGGKKLGPLV